MSIIGNITSTISQYTGIEQKKKTEEKSTETSNIQPKQTGEAKSDTGTAEVSSVKGETYTEGAGGEKTKKDPWGSKFFVGIQSLFSKKITGEEVKADGESRAMGEKDKGEGKVDAGKQEPVNDTEKTPDTSNIPSKQKQSEINGQLKSNQKAWDSYQKLSQSERKKFDELSEKLYHEGKDGKTVGTNEDLVKLLEQGKLKNYDGKITDEYDNFVDVNKLRDKDGKGLLDNLNSMADQKFAEGLDKNKIMNETLSNLANPDKINQGKKGAGDRGTCTVTCLEYLNAKNNPAEYTRIVAGLTGEKGEVELRNGETMKIADNVIKGDNSGRTNVDRIYQASMVNYAVGGGYDNSTNRVADLDTKTKQLYEKDFQGLNGKELNKVMNGVLSDKSEVFDYKPDENAQVRGSTEYKISEAIKEGNQVPVELNGHKVIVERMDPGPGGKVYIRDPYGDGATGNKGGGHREMSKDEFFGQLKNYHLSS
ncbi:MAG: hypothetical protein ABRQ37_22510 [Candidatus Eremiobacterota bacterium]